MTGALRRIPFRILAAAIVGVATLTGCAATTYDEDSTGSAPASTVAGDGTPLSIAGPAAELLPELAATAESLTGVMIAEGDDDAAAQRIDALWRAVEPEVAATRPDLVGDFDANVRRTLEAVRFRRAADADKAAANLRALVDAYLA